MPALAVMRDTLEDLNEPRLRGVRGNLRPKRQVRRHSADCAGAEFFNSLDDAIAWTGDVTKPPFQPMSTPVNVPVTGERYDTVCFFIAPIGSEGSEPRRHSDAILSSYVEKALATIEPQLRVVRADKITQPGLITKQVLEYLLNSRLVVADLSYHNPNVFYELAVRHATGKPVIHIKLAADSIPFDNQDFRTINIEFEDKYEILAQLDIMRSEIALFARQSIATGDNSDNPLLIYFPDHRLGKVK